MVEIKKVKVVPGWKETSEAFGKVNELDFLSREDIRIGSWRPLSQIKNIFAVDRQTLRVSFSHQVNALPSLQTVIHKNRYISSECVSYPINFILHLISALLPACSSLWLLLGEIAPFAFQNVFAAAERNDNVTQLQWLLLSFAIIIRESPMKWTKVEHTPFFPTTPYMS